MIAPDLLQAALIAHLRADATLVAALPELANGIRESQWRGAAFQYPCVRVGRPALAPYGNGTCSDRDARAMWEVQAISKADSSITAQGLQGLVLAALEGRALTTAALKTISIRPVTLSPVQPAGNPQTVGISPVGDVWIGPIMFRTIVTQL